MNRRSFLQGVATGPLAVHELLHAQAAGERTATGSLRERGVLDIRMAPVQGHTEVCRFNHNGASWVVYEDLRSRDGVLTFISGETARVFSKRVEPVFASVAKPYCGRNLEEICLAGPDLLAGSLLRDGDPLEDAVRDAAPPMNSAPPPKERDWRPRWETFVGTSECEDTMPVYPAGNTRTYHPNQYFPELTQEQARSRYEGLVGGWMPAPRKVFPMGRNSYTEVIVFGDVLAKDRYIVQTWHRTAHFENGHMMKVVYGYSYPVYTRRRQPPPPEAFYAALLAFGQYWEAKLADTLEPTFPDASWADMVRFAFVREQMVRPGGVYPKYGAVDRDYYGPEYDGFQDTLTMSLYSNLVCGRFALTKAVLHNYFDDFIDERGMVNMRGPETAQYGLMLTLAALYVRYTGDKQSLARCRQKLAGIATLLAELQDEALQLPAGDPGHGLIHGWCESDACLAPHPDTWWKPYFANSAYAVQEWRELAAIWPTIAPPPEHAQAQSWQKRSDALQRLLQQSVEAHTRRDMKPPYVPPLPGVTTMFRESLAKQHPSEQGWIHRCYTELLQSGVLTMEQEQKIFDTMRCCGATTMGVVANVEPANPESREILGFVSYGYAHALLRHDRVGEYLLFLYAHRYHAHSRGSWTAAEVSGITGDGALFCIPAQQTIPLLLRWMLVFEDAGADCLFLGRAVPRAWLAQGEPISIRGAPTRWGRVDYALQRKNNQCIARVELLNAASAPAQIALRFRVPQGERIVRVMVNGQAIETGQPAEEVLLRPEKKRVFDVVVDLEQRLRVEAEKDGIRGNSYVAQDDDGVDGAGGIGSFRAGDQGGLRAGGQTRRKIS